MANEIFLNNNQKFHVFSKSPITPTQGLSQVVNKSGHTTTTADVWANDIPWFFKADNKDVALSTGVDAKLNDMVLIGSAVYKRNKTEKFEGATFDDLWDSYVLENGTKIYNSDEVHVLTYHKNVPISFLTAGANTNNAGQASNYAGRIFIGGKVVEQFVVSTDKLSGGIPSTGYGVAVYKSGEPLSEGELESNFLANSYAGIIQFNKKVGPSTAFTADVFEYKGAKLDAEVARIAAAVFGDNVGGDEDASLTQKVAQNTAAIATLNGDANTSGSVAKAVSDAVSAAEGRVNVTTDALAGRIAQLEGIQHFSVVIVPEGQTIENVTPLVENTIYLVKDADAAEGTYIEYIAYKPAGSTTVVTEKIGSTALDLSGYTTDDEHTALANRVTALDAATTGRVAVVEGKVSSLEDQVSTLTTETIPAIQQSVTEARTYAEQKASAAQTAATNAASQALTTARGEITQEIAAAQSAAESTAADELAAAVEQIGKDIETAKQAAISSSTVTLSQSTTDTGILVTPNATAANSFTIGVDKSIIATAASVTALTQTVTSNKTELEGKITAAQTAATTAASTALEAAKTEIKGTTDALDTRLQTAEGKVSTLEGQVANLTTGDNSVAKQIEAAANTIKGQSLAKSGSLDGMFSVATAGSVGAGITSITITDTGLSAAIAAAKSGAEQTAATALSTARGEITTEISNAVNGLETKLTTGEGSLGAKVAALETATGTTLPAAIEQALEDAKAYSDSLHTTSLDYVVLGDSEKLPDASADTLGKIYLVASQNVPTTDGSAISGSYVEYMTRKVSETEYTWEKIGTTAADLSAYAKTADVTTAIATAKSEAIAAAKTETTTQVNALAATHAADKTALEASIATKVGEVQWFGENDLLSTKAEVKDGKLVVTEQEVSNPNKELEYSATAAWNANVTKVVNNEAFNADGEKIATIETSKIKNGKSMFYQTNLSEYESDLSSLTNGTWMFSATKIAEFIGDMNSLTEGNDMFGMDKELHTFIGDLSSLTDGYCMFHNCWNLTTFISDLSSLTNGYNMFQDTNLSLESIECIADTINEYEDSIRISWKTLPAEDKRQELVNALSRIVDKGWGLLTNQELLPLFDSEKYQIVETTVQPIDLDGEPETDYYVTKK